MRRLFGCPDIVSLTEKFLMARNFFWIFTENNPVMGDSKTLCIPEAKELKRNLTIWFYRKNAQAYWDGREKNNKIKMRHCTADLHVQYDQKAETFLFQREEAYSYMYIVEAVLSTLRWIGVIYMYLDVIIDQV